MTEDAPVAAPDEPIATLEESPGLPDADAELVAVLAALRNCGAAQRDGAGFHYLETLARRLQDAPPALAPRLRDSLRQALAGWDVVAPAPVHPEEVATERAEPPDAGAPASLLAGLNEHLASSARAGADLLLAPPGERWPALRSAQRFHDAWSRVHAEEQLERAIGRGPAQAGPLNSHKLVLRTLTLMRELSPAYLRGFLARAEALLQVEQALAGLRPPVVKAKPAANPNAGARPKPDPKAKSKQKPARGARARR